MKEVSPDLLQDTNEFIHLFDKFVTLAGNRFEFQSIVAGTMGWLVVTSKNCNLSEEEFIRMFQAVWQSIELPEEEDGQVS